MRAKELGSTTGCSILIQGHPLLEHGSFARSENLLIDGPPHFTRQNFIARARGEGRNHDLL